MKRKIALTALCMIVVAVAAPALFAAEGDPIPANEEQAKFQAMVKAAPYLALAIGFGLAITAIGGAFSQGKAIAAAVDAMARQPEAGGRIQTAMIIGLALIETLVIYMLLIAFMLLGKF